MGEFLSAKEHLENAIILYDPERPLAFPAGFDHIVFCLSYAAWTLWQAGYPDQALARGNEALALAQGLSHPYSLALGGFYFFRRVASNSAGSLRSSTERRELGSHSLPSTD